MSVINILKDYEQFKFRPIKKDGLRLTKEDLKKHLEEQQKYEVKEFYCNICKKSELIKNVNKHIHVKLDKYDKEYIYGSSDSD